MNQDFLLYIVALMILYDLSIHIIYLLKIDEYLLKNNLNYWPNFKKYSKNIYQLFWTIYWGGAFIILIFYFLQ